MWADALRERCPMVHNDYASLPHRQGLPPGHAPVLRELVVPILRNEQVVALLGVGNMPGNYGPEDLKSVSQLASQAWDTILAKRAEEEIQRQAALIRSLLDSIPDIVFFKNTEGVCLGCNPAFVEFMGRPRNEIIGKTDHDLSDQEMADAFREQDQQMLALRKPHHNEEWVTYPDGRKTLQDTLKTPYWSLDGELIGVLGISRDITAQKQAEAALRESEQFLQATLNALSGHLAILDENGITMAVNRAWREFAKANSENTANLCERANYLAVCDTAAGNGCAEAAAFAAGLRAVIQGRQHQFKLEYTCDSPDEKRWFMATVTRFSGGQGTCVAVVHDDITERKQAQEMLREREQRLDYLLTSTPITIYTCHASGDFGTTYVSENVQLETGYRPDAFLKQPAFWVNHIHPDDRERVLAGMAALFSHDHHIHEYRFRHQNGTYRWMYDELRLLRDAAGQPAEIIGSWIDITRRKEAETALHASLVEKTTLLQEIHHRVKNNLQIICSLLNLQAGQVKDVAMLELLSTTRNRVGAMALLHENLYQSENLARLHLPAYVERLCAQLLRAIGPGHTRVRLERQVEPKTVSLTLDQAVPCGLLLNELVTNALKYAFPGDRSGCIRVTLERATPQSARITVADDGVGLPATLDPRRTSSLGLRLVSLLTGQLHGTVNFERGPGTTVHILFPNALPTQTPHE